jgi:probable rRNA maturation factor
MAIHYYEEAVSAQLKQKRALSAYLKSLVLTHLEVKKIDINFIFCDDAYLLEKNIAFLNHHTLTDIITFDLSDDEEILNAEIYISVERVKENAITFATSYQHELHRIIFHGVLHLCGFKDKKPADKTLMTEMENLSLQQYFSA